MNKTIESLREAVAGMSPQQVLAFFMRKYPGQVALSSSLSYEDQTLTQMMVQIDRNARVFTLDTGRMFPETYELLDKTCMKYNIRIEVFFPDYAKVQEMVRQHGINLFYESVELRHKCCEIRKIEPLKRALKDVSVWVSGLRREQSPTRKDMQMIEWDESDSVIKLNPLIDWTEDMVKDYIKANHIPYNKLHDKGFPSIGCQPCTRAVAPGESIRAGRWWWEDPDHRECGLHVKR